MKKKYPETELIIVEEQDPKMFLDEVDLPQEVETAIQNADLLISYIRHPDVTAEICDRQKPVILAINFGQGFLNQVKSYNPKVAQPISMCNATPDTGIEIIDEYFEKFSSPVYNVVLEYKDLFLPPWELRNRFVDHAPKLARSRLRIRPIQS